MKPTHITAIRKGLNQNISSFARTVGVTRQTVHNWEAGRSTPTGPAAKLLHLIEEQAGL
jgi:hypothetical protein